MDPSKLNAFVWSARYKSFSKAAQELHVVASTISRQIAALEDELDTQLFYRNSHDVTLTPAGQRLYDASLSYFEQFRYIRENSWNLMHQEENRIIITSGPFEFPLVTPLMEQYRRQAPEAVMQLAIYAYKKIFPRPRTLVLTLRSPEIPPSGWEQFSLGRFPWKVVARRDSPFWQMTPHQQRRLQDQKLILYGVGETTPSLLRDWLKAHDFQPRDSISATSFNGICSHLALEGVSLLPEYLEPWLPSFLRMEQIFPDPPQGEVLLLLNSERPAPPERQFFRYIRDHYRLQAPLYNRPESL